MAGLKKFVAVVLAVTLVAALGAYLLRPTAGPTAGTVETNEPDTPDTPDTGSDPGTGPGDQPTVTQPPAHGKAAQNSNGPKHVVCLLVNLHIPEHALDEGANRYRGQCEAVLGLFLP